MSAKKPKHAKPGGSQPPAGEGGQQQQGGTGQQYGEGNYAATRQYNAGVADHVKNHDVEREARDAAPRNAAEEKEMQDAERVGRSKARGGDEEDVPDDAGQGG
jgi:hypothetical protein